MSDTAQEPSAADEMTKVILSAWDEIEGGTPDEDSSVTTEPVATTLDSDEDRDEVAADEQVDEQPTSDDEAAEVLVPSPGEEDEEEEPSEEEAEEEDEPSGDEEAPTASAFDSDDPQVRAFLAQHGNDVETALREAAKFANVLGRQGRELGQLRQRNEQLESEIEQIRAFQQTGTFMSEEQREWVEEAVGSGNPLAYIQSAVNEGEFDLARSVLEQGEFSTVQALKLAQAIDRAEEGASPVEQVPPLQHEVLLGVLAEHYPDMPKFEAEMITTMQALGPDHALVMLAHSQDPGQAAQGIIGLYEIARAKTATVTSTREQVRQKSRAAADAVRDKAVVSSGAASPPKAQVARSTTLMPGLTLESLEAEFDRQAQE